MITPKEQEQLNCIPTTDVVKDLIKRLENSNAIEFISKEDRKKLVMILHNGK